MTFPVAAGLNTPPWPTEAEWQGINACIAEWTARRWGRLHLAAAAAVEIRRRIHGLDPLMEGLCEEACARCREVCCRTATVWFDFRDLVYLHLAGVPAPPGQIRRKDRGPCPLLSRSGCRLDRPSRPFVCTWYVCPEHRRLLAGRFSGAHLPVTVSISRIQRLRESMETGFLEAVS